MSLDNLGNRIKTERQKRNITQEKLAEMVDISTNFMSLIENGRNMSVDTIIKIAESLGVTVDYLLNETLPIQDDTISNQIINSLSNLNDDEKLFFLNMIKQYKTLKD